MTAVPAFGGENAVFNSGLRLHIDRHEESSGVVRLFTRDGVTELPSTAIAWFEPDDYVPPPPPPDPPKPEIKPAPAQPPDTRDLISAAAQRSGLPQKFVQSVAKAESGFDPKAVSPKGAIGVMQLMPATAQALGADPRDPAQNIDAGTRLLRELLVKYSGDVAKALAAYNAGEKAVDVHQGVPPYSETQRYVDKVVRDYLSSQEK
ncbi:MAG TPA: lytic transglycosylase domain-containing protein [Bryobacteraceae bacterium]